MGPDGVVFLLPDTDDASSTVEWLKPVYVQTLVSQFPVE
jgi:hypothetical protein